ncbi:MAG: DUF721 domain-containing protein [Candidatus Cloacimonetes bacterium]|nr:DUF721 domain-containing protein [Candidatus Cloacimonadota bacterium]
MTIFRYSAKPMALTQISYYGKRLALRLGGERYRGYICLYQNWKDVVGELLAQKSYPLRFQDGILYVAVENNSWQQELLLHKEEIIFKCVRACQQEIRDLLFYIRS